MNEVVAIIPARGGSKRIPEKNLRLFRGRPIIAWSIQAAQESGCFDRIVVSTDDPRIAAIARQFGAEVPFTRPACLADDQTPTVPVIRHAIETLESFGDAIEEVCCLYATAPFVTPENIAEGLSLLRQGPDVDYVATMTTFPFPIYRSVRRDDEGWIQMNWPEHELTRSQDLPETFHDAGQFYWGTKAAFMFKTGIFSAKTRPLMLPRHCVQDIDTPEDWARAELMHEALHRMSSRKVA